jgi:hypothetical protein
MDLKPTLGPSGYALEVAPGLRKQAVGRTQPVSEQAQSIEALLPAGRKEKAGNFVHSLAFVENEPPPAPKVFKKGIPLVERITLPW